MNLKQNYLTQSGCYKAGKRITVKGLMIPKIPYQLYIYQPMFSPKSSIISL